ncbi:unnamed protein product [Auanema sp. JU1783]|nr:unnamed protein product [Auanema sp. JU1783]
MGSQFVYLVLSSFTFVTAECTSSFYTIARIGICAGDFIPCNNFYAPVRTCAAVSHLKYFRSTKLEKTPTTTASGAIPSSALTR